MSRHSLRGSLRNDLLATVLRALPGWFVVFMLRD
jgi:hypothetical protein